MKQYIGTKILLATAMTLGAYNRLRGWEIPQEENPDREGYLVEYPLVGEDDKPNHPDYEGYISWSPKPAFEEAYRQNGSLSFGDALLAMERGRRVCRSGWNGKGMFLWKLPAATIPKAWIKDAQFAAVANEVAPDSENIEVLGTIRMKTADDKILTGWLASQSDMEAKDWMILPDPEDPQEKLPL